MVEKLGDTKKTSSVSEMGCLSAGGIVCKERALFSWDYVCMYVGINMGVRVRVARVCEMQSLL